MEIMKPVKGFIGITVGAILGGHAMGAVGGVAAIPRGIGSATQSLIGVGIVGHAASTTKDMFKWK